MKVVTKTRSDNVTKIKHIDCKYSDLQQVMKMSDYFNVIFDKKTSLMPTFLPK